MSAREAVPLASPSVTFVVPVHDGARYLGECLTSILAQTVVPFEVVVVDDGSVDGSGDIARAFDPPVRCVRQQHRGAASARNRGVIEAQGDLIAFLDADDLVVPLKLERQLERFLADPALDLCDAYSRNFWTPEIAPEARNVVPRESFTHGEVPKPGLIITWLLRRTLFERLGGFDEGLTIGEDAEWRDRVDATGIVTETLDEVLAMRRLHADNMTRRHYDEYLRHVVRRCKARVSQAGSMRGIP